MKLLSSLVLACSAAALSACLPDLTESGFETPNDDGSFNVVLDESGTQVVIDEGNGNGYSYLIGYDEDTYLGVGIPVITVVAGVLPGSQVSDLPGSGSATFNGTYEAVHIDLTQANAESTVEELEALFFSSGDIALVANFGAGTLTGAAGDLTVSGTFSDETLGGTVTHDGLTGDLEGIVGGDGAVGVFTGDNFTEILVGGFNVADTTTK